MIPNGDYLIQRTVTLRLAKQNFDREKEIVK